MNIKILTTSGLLIAIALLLAVNIISDKTLKTARLDSFFSIAEISD